MIELRECVSARQPKRRRRFALPPHSKGAWSPPSVVSGDIRGFSPLPSHSVAFTLGKGWAGAPESSAHKRLLTGAGRRVEWSHTRRSETTSSPEPGRLARQMEGCLASHMPFSLPAVEPPAKHRPAHWTSLSSILPRLRRQRGPSATCARWARWRCCRFWRPARRTGTVSSGTTST